MNIRFSEVMDWFRQLIVRDTARKAIALLLAVILYCSVSYKSQEQQPPRVLQNVPVTLELPDGMVNLQGADFTVQLHVRGPERRLARLTSESFKGVCPVPESARKITLDAEMFQPKHYGVMIEKIEPSVLHLNLEKRESRRLAVQPVFDAVDRLPAGYEICGWAVEPKNVMASGPASVIGALQQLRTRPVPLDGSTREGFDFVADLQNLAGVRMQPTRVTLHVEIRRKAQGERSLSGIPCHLLLSPEQRRTFSAELVQGRPSAVDVVVRGADDARMALRPNSIRVFADLTGLKNPGEYTMPLAGAFLTPDARKLEIVRISPKQVRVVIRRNPENK